MYNVTWPISSCSRMEVVHVLQKICCMLAYQIFKKQKGINMIVYYKDLLKKEDKNLNIKDLIKEAHENAKAHGWWDEDRGFGEQIALIHSELSEALEEFRDGKDYTEIYSDEKGKPCGIPTELADVLIRIFDTCGRYGIDLESAIKLKMDYNKTRPYKHGGKVI